MRLGAGVELLTLELCLFGACVCFRNLYLAVSHLVDDILELESHKVEDGEANHRDGVLHDASLPFRKDLPFPRVATNYNRVKRIMQYF